MNLHSAVLDTLKGKRFALIGFDGDEAERLASAFQSAGAFARKADNAPAHPGLNSLAPFDAFVLNASAAANGNAELSEMMARSEKPAMMVGTEEEMMSHAQAVASLEHDFLIRPWSAAELLVRAYRALRHAGKPVDEFALRDEPKVMVVDDDKTTTTLLAMLLRAAKIRCDVVHSGAEALPLASRVRPDLLLLDISMPKVDGFQVLAALRSDPVTRDLPVMMISVSDGEKDVLRGFSLGVEDYITKPFNPRELMARIGRVLRRPRPSQPRPGQ
jgi:DNA-binding response OmpR family regulator